MKFGHNYFNARKLGFWFNVHWDTATVIANFSYLIGMQRDFDSSAMTAQGFVHRVIDNLPQAMHQATRVRRADVHAGALANCVKAF